MQPNDRLLVSRQISIASQAKRRSRVLRNRVGRRHQTKDSGVNKETYILHLHDVKGYYEASIKAQYPWFELKHIARFREHCSTDGGDQLCRIEQINEYVSIRATQAMNSHQPLHDYMFVREAVLRAGELNARSFFTVRHTWLLKFKKSNDVTSRKITNYITDASTENRDQVEGAIRAFHDQYISHAFRYPPRLIFNIDQTGFNHAFYRDRTLARKGSRDVNILVDCQNKRTHSYTAQPMISRDGRLFGKLLLCLQEATGKFGVRIEPAVRELERKYGNIEVVASKLGKMSKELTIEWMRRVLAPALASRLRSKDTNTALLQRRAPA